MDEMETERALLLPRRRTTNEPLNRTGICFQKENFLRIMAHIIFILPCCWFRASSSWPWWKQAPYMAMSVVFAVLQWLAFGVDIYGDFVYHPKPIGTFILMVLLFLSGIITYTLAVAYFYNPKNRFLASSTRLLPRIEFNPDGEQEEIGPNKTDWVYTNIFLLIGTIDVAIMFTLDYEMRVFFNVDETDYIVTFNRTLPPLYWALEGGVVMCCVFFVLTRDIVRHIEFTQCLIVGNYHDLTTAKRRYLCLLNYTKKAAASLQLWFVVHSTLFFFLILFDMIDLLIWPTVYEFPYRDLYWAAQVTGSFLIAFKFAFPFFAASRVSRRFDDMLKVFNKHFDVEHHRNSDSFLTFCERQKAGFTICGIRITFNLAMLSFLFSFFGMLKKYMMV